MYKTLEDLADISYGKDYKSNPKGDDIPIYGTGGVMGYTSIPLNTGPAILTGRKGSINNPIYVEGDFWNVDTIFCVKAKHEISNKWIYYNLLNTDLSKLNEATGVPSVNAKSLYRIRFRYFEIARQRKIAKILSTCDTVIAKTEEAIAKYQAIKQGMMHDLFTRGIDLSTGKLRPKYQDAPELYKESELGMIPKDWKVKRLEEFGSFKKGSNIPKYLLTPNGVGCILYGQLYTTFHDVIKQSYTKIPENHVKGMSPLNQGDILFAGSGETHEEIGKCAVLLSEEEIYAGGDIVILSLSENYCKPYFGYLLNFEPIQKQKAKLGQGSSVIHIYSNHLGSLKLSLPNKMEQEAIYQKIQSISEKISFEESTLSKYYQIKSGLMQDLLSGKVEVNV